MDVRAELLRTIHAHGMLDMRGGWRLVKSLSRGLTSYPIDINGVALYVDLESMHGNSLQMLSDYRKYEPAEQAVLRRLVRPGAVVYDIGASLGFYSALFASLVGSNGRVVSFEPNPRLIPNLKRTAG